MITKNRILAATLCLGLASPISAMSNVEVSGDYLGGFNFIRQKNETSKRTHFDYAINLDITFDVSEKVSGGFQLQSSPGNGALGFGGPATALTDVYITVDRPYGLFTAGSFDTPFGQQVPYLSNNASTLGNALIMNDIFYSAFGGTMGTLNTVGIKGEWETEHGDYQAAITNGTSEASKNSDGRLEWVLSGNTGDLLGEHSIGASAMASADNEGFATDFSAWIIDGHFTFGASEIKAYLGSATYDDNTSGTEDSVTIWMGEFAHDLGMIGIAARISAWAPKDDNGNGTGISTAIPSVGLATTQGSTTVVKDQAVMRYQVGITREIEENVTLRADVFIDDYAKTSGGENTDITGAMAFVAVSF